VASAQPVQPPVKPAAAAGAAGAGELTAVQLIERLAELLGQASRQNPEALNTYLARSALTLYDPSRELTDKDLAGLSEGDRRLLLAYQRTFTMLGRNLGHGDDRQQ